ncbi:MAG: NUDIX domain-containing protein [Actinobacteria bacterium]|nr:NUDIX domain-containing protein [Thermoleophilia bacterium]MCB9010904.1 NUDIX domain-containing protein [Actinomycetota bacterium]
MKAVRVELVVMTVRDQALDVLLVRYPGNEWALPGGSATPPRQVEAAAVEILAEQTGVRDISLEQLYTFDRDQGRGVSIDYLALIAADRHPLVPGAEVVEVRWFPLGDLPAMPDPHRCALGYAVTRLRAKTAYAPIAVQVLPETFTLGELQSVYEAVLGTTLDTRNFRRDVLNAGIVEDVGRERRTSPGRPARLYRSVPGEFAVVAEERRIAGRVRRSPEGGPPTDG